MKKNLFILFLVIILSVILIYPLGYILNQFVFHQQGGGFDVGPDDMMVDIFIGAMVIPPLLSSFMYSFWGKGKQKWIYALILSLPSVIFFRWAGIYLVIPLISFVSGIILAKLINFIISKLKRPNPPMMVR